MEIVGVVGDLNQNGPDAAELPEVFEPEAQSTMRSMTFRGADENRSDGYGERRGRSASAGSEVPGLAVLKAGRAL